MKIGVFDSGIGGKSVADALSRALPKTEVIFRPDDPAHFPYATKTPEELYGFVVPVLQRLVDEGCEVIVVACNTVSTTLITQLREVVGVPLVAIEPMIKPAAQLTHTGVIAVCATPTTLASPRYAELKATYAAELTVFEPDCADWSSLIERGTMSEARIRECIAPSLTAGADVIVLGCTHYHWIEDEIRALVGERAVVIQPEQAIAAQVKRVLSRLP